VEVPIQMKMEIPPVEEVRQTPIVEAPKPIEAPVPSPTRSFFDDIA
jgi:hypothetical protein